MENKSKLCRTCLGIGEYDVSSELMMVFNENIQINTILKEFTNLDIENIDVDRKLFPSLICELCLDKLIQCYKFLQQIQKADDHIMSLLVTPQNTTNDDNFTHNGIKNSEVELISTNGNELICSNDGDGLLIEVNNQLDNDQVEIEEYTVGIVDDKYNIINKNPLTNVQSTEIDPNKTKLDKKRKADEMVKKIENHSSIIDGVSENELNDNDHSVEIPNKRFKIPNFQNSVTADDDMKRFVITKFIPNEVITTATFNTVNENNGDVTNQLEQYNQCDIDNSIIKTKNVIRTYDLAAIEIDPTDKEQFEKLIGTIFDEDDDDDDNYDIDDDNISINAVYACQYCTRAFSTSQFLKQHIRKTHSCQFCMKSFHKNTELFEHIRKSHSEFNCPFCDKIYKSNSNLRLHLKKVHSFKLPAHTSLLAFSKKDILSTN